MLKVAIYVEHFSVLVFFLKPGLFFCYCFSISFSPPLMFHLVLGFLLFFCFFASVFRPLVLSFSVFCWRQPEAPTKKKQKKTKKTKKIK